MSPVLIISAVVLLVVVALLLWRRSADTADAPSGEVEARRFARLLLAELKLNHGSQIEAGRRNKDLYPRLKEEIERARRKYEGRVRPDAAARADYFHEELVREIAGGDASALVAGHLRD